MQPHRKRFHENRKHTLAFLPLPFFSLTLSLGAAVNTFEKEAQAAAAFSKPDHTWAQVDWNNLVMQKQDLKSREV